jgi:succinate dehydrogenase/fumarate reductase flavoprotein subunit
VITERFEVVVVGAGAAGIMAAAHAATSPGAPHTLLVTDGPLGRANTVMAQGGIQVPFPTPESRQAMLDDMTRSARVPVDLVRVSRFIDAIPDTVSQLEAWGLALDRGEGGALVRRRAGGLSEARIVSTGAGLGPQLMAALRRGLEGSGAELRTDTRVIGITPGTEGIAVDMVDGDGAARVIGDAVVVSTGGRSHAVATARGERSTNPANGNAAMASVIRDLGVEEAPGDYFQYQPFGVVEAPGPFARCVPESVVTFEPRLLDHNGDDVGGVGEDRLDLTARMFAVAEAGNAVDTGHGRGLWLALDRPGAESLLAAFPKLARTLQRHRLVDGLLGQGRVLVWPYLHYQTGGFVTDADGATPIPGLYLAGEMVGGLHGRNRLMGNGITDSLVHGRIVGRAAAGGGGA